MRLIDAMTKENIVTVHRKTIDADVPFLLTLMYTPQGSAYLEHVKSELMDRPVMRMWNKLVKVHKLDDKIDASAFGGIIALEIDSTEALIFYIISLLDFYDHHKRKALLSDILLFVYPKGMIDSLTLRKTIDDVVKLNKTTHSYIYYTMGLEFVNFRDHN